jgi:hypothetical protein
MKTNSLIQAVAYSMECALATIESEADKKKPSKSVINRHIAIVRNVLIDVLSAAESPVEAAELKNDMVNYTFNYIELAPLRSDLRLQMRREGLGRQRAQVAIDS